MIITKKRFEEEIRKARDEEIRRFEEMKMKADEARWQNDHLCNIEKRMSTAFVDIDRRLNALEKKQNENGLTPVRY